MDRMGDADGGRLVWGGVGWGGVGWGGVGWGGVGLGGVGWPPYSRFGLRTKQQACQSEVAQRSARIFSGDVQIVYPDAPDQFGALKQPGFETPTPGCLMQGSGLPLKAPGASEYELFHSRDWFGSVSGLRQQSHEEAPRGLPSKRKPGNPEWNE